MSEKSIIAYYSRKGENYVNGNIINLMVGNTEVAATMIQKITGSDIFHIEAVKQYPKDYTETTEVAKKELREDARPELTSKVSNMDSYDVIYLGYPNWWGTFPMAVSTFLEAYDFSGKTIIPFCTHEGSGLGRSESDIKKLCACAKVKKGLAIKGSNVKTAEKDISYWIKNII
jgi:flavodoxin